MGKRGVKRKGGKRRIQKERWGEEDSKGKVERGGGKEGRLPMTIQSSVTSKLIHHILGQEDVEKSDLSTKMLASIMKM